LQLVGATGSFIKRPFLRRAISFGFFAGAIASSILLGLIFYANNKIEDLSQLQRQEDIALLFGVLILLGVGVAYISTYRAVNKYLKTSLDELY
jgi:cell division transport system permease protein